MNLRFRWKAVGGWLAIALLLAGCLGASALLSQRRQQARLSLERDRANLRFPFGPNAPFALNPDLQCFPLPSYLQLVGLPTSRRDASGLPDLQHWPEMMARMKPGDELYQYKQISPLRKALLVFRVVGAATSL